MKLRSVTVALALAIAPLVVQGGGAVAQGGERWVNVPASSQTTSKTHPCFDGVSHSATCTSVDTLEVGAHQELRMEGTLACYGRYYGTYTVSHWEYGGFGNLLWHTWITGQDWYDGCTVGINWGPGGGCQAYEGWQCSTVVDNGAFWNASLWAEDHYRDQETVYDIPIYGRIGQYMSGMRFYLQPNGHYWDNQWSYCEIC